MSVRAPHVCPICGCEVAPRNGTPKNLSFPFCSPACKVVDLGRWFDGTYRIPAPSELSSGLSPPSPSPDLRAHSDGGEPSEGEVAREEDE
jgi:endogenous inhibitor of DNA gyrase (YacG/DUF329 family)